MSPSDILILSNGPGEVTTWVKPVVKQLRANLGDDRSQCRISVILSPCGHATGREADLALSYPEVDRAQAATHFFPFLLWGQTQENWDWRDRGVVLFLGGDQFFPVVIGKRLGYSIVIYAEWQARWYPWVNRFGVMNAEVVATAPPQYASKLAVVGDLMVEAGNQAGAIPHLAAPRLQVGLLPGSKANKLIVGMPLLLAIANHLQRLLPQVHLVIPVAPTLDLPTLASYADPGQNLWIDRLGWERADLVEKDGQAYLKTSQGVEIELWQQFPAYDLLSQCQLCLTTVGANTAELGALGVPMLVLLPTQQMEAMKAWDGLPGLIARIPGLGTVFLRLFNQIMVRRLGLVGNSPRRVWLAWPNIWAKREIVPELVGALQPQGVAEQAVDLLNHPDQLQAMGDRLRQVRGQPGAAAKLVALVMEELAAKPGD